MGSLAEAMNLTGRVALITGGSRGLGLQVAEALGEAGARLILTSRKADDLQSAQKHLSKLGIKADWIAADAQKTADVDRLVEESLDRAGRIDILVNNAGASWGAPAADHPLDAWDKVMNLNVRSIFYLTQQIAKRSMIPNSYGRIVMMASIAGLRGGALDGIPTLAYNTSKGALVNMTRALASEWGKYGITVNALAPGWFRSKMTDGVIAQLGVDKMIANVPLKRLGDEDDLKGAAVLFASNAGKHITGQILAIDGGATAI